MLLTGLAVHPVKSTAIRPVDSARVRPGGLEDDRTWVVVDRDGVVVTAREAHALFTIVADTPATDPSLDRALRLRSRELPGCRTCSWTSRSERACASGSSARSSRASRPDPRPMRGCGPRWPGRT